MKALKFFATAACAAALAVSCNTSSAPEVDVEMPTAAEVDSVSYLLGVNIGSFIKGNNFAEDLSELNMTEFKKGIVAFLEAEGSPYDPDFASNFRIDPNEMGRILNGFLTKKQNYKAAVNLAKGREFLVANALKEGDRVQLIGFGTFEVKDVAAREGRNPKTGEVIKIEASKRPVFTAAKALKDQVKSECAWTSI